MRPFSIAHSYVTNYQRIGLMGHPPRTAQFRHNGAAHLRAEVQGADADAWLPWNANKRRRR